MIKMTILTTEAIRFLTQELQDKGEIAIGLSGGKDSIVTVDLMRRSGLAFIMIHSMTGIDPPEIVRFIKQYYPETIFLRPRRSFFHDITTQNPPARFCRWCCRTLKKEPAQLVPHIHRVMGTRALESVRRSKYPRVNEFVKIAQIHYYPILQWTEKNVWDYIHRHNLPYPSLYDEGFDRIGCIICPYHSYDLHRFYRARWPRFFDVFERQVKKWYYKRKKQGREMYHDTPEAFLEDWYYGRVLWYKHEEKTK